MFTSATDRVALGPRQRCPKLFDLRARQDTNKGFSDALARGLELVVTPLLFGFFGYLADRGLGISPVLTLGGFAFGVIGTAVKLKLGYDREMAVHDGSAATRPRVTTPPAPSRRSAP